MNLSQLAALATPQNLQEGRSDLGSLIETYQDQRKMYSMEGPRGVRNFTSIIGVLGYRDLDSFLEDNSGALSAMLEWIGSQRNSEWTESFTNATQE